VYKYAKPYAAYSRVRLKRSSTTAPGSLPSGAPAFFGAIVNSAHIEGVDYGLGKDK